jgi:capsular polysaccharide biosynthesis protein
MELILIIRVLLRRWWLVAIPVVVAAALVLPGFLSGQPAASGGYTATFRYSAAQVLEAIPNRDGDYQDVWLASEYTVNAMTDWVRTTSFADEITRVAAGQGLTINPAALGVAADNKRSIGQITLSYPDAAGLETILEAAMDVLKTRAQDYFPQLGQQPAQVTFLDSPQVAAAPPPVGDRLAPFIRLGIGLLAGIGLALLAEYLDPNLRRREQVEALGLPVIASIPREQRRNPARPPAV